MSKICLDGNVACARIAYKLSEVSAIYPITPSSPMAEACDEMVLAGEKTLFGKPLKLVEMQSEAGVAGAVHGSLKAGALTTTFTCSQGLMLMIPNMFKIAGELLPTVFHVSARAVATHALSIFGDHSDVMAARSTGFLMLASSSVQEAQDCALIAHIASLRTSLPFIHFFDGFRTSHEIQKIEDISDQTLFKLLPKEEIEKFRNRALSPKNPHQSGTAQNPDVFFQNREASNSFYDKAYEIINQTMLDVEKEIKRSYRPFEYYGDSDAENVVVVMGSASQTIKDVISKIQKNREKFSSLGKIGVLNVRLYRPFNSQAFAACLPKTTKRICVLDRTKESGSVGEPLYVDVCTALNKVGREIKVVGGRYGLGSKEFTPSCAIAVFENLAREQKNSFTVGIEDDVTNTSLNLNSKLADLINSTIEKDCYQMMFFGLGSDGTISANKNSIKIIGNSTDKFVQGYFEYDSKKSGSLTVSHLRISDREILMPYEIERADFIAIHNYSFISRFNILKHLKQNGVVLLNTVLKPEELDKKLPIFFKQDLIKKNAKLYIIDAQNIASEVGLGNKINTIMQSAFFKVSNIIDFESAKNQMIEAARKTYMRKGESVVKANERAVLSFDRLEFVPLSLLSEKTFEDEPKNFGSDGCNSVCVNCIGCENEIKFANEVMKPISLREGNNLKVSAFAPDGRVPTGTSQFEKRGIALRCPNWNSDLCVQCGRCVMACPHAAIRAVLVDENEIKDAPEGFITKDAIGVKGAKYRIQVSPLDCTGCGVCANVCIAKDKALKMEVAPDLSNEIENYNYSKTLKQTTSPFNKFSTKGLQFYRPYFEFSGACGGCGETPYIKLLSQLYGENIIIANATGCSSIYGGSFPSCPYSKDENGNGPAWANSLFEDNAEFGFGIKLGRNVVEEGKEKSNVWIIGGDGWAYDIGYGGLDHVLHSNENVNILVLDTEVYSNTGGQSSKSTPSGAVAKFASGGKKTAKKDLGAIAIMSNNAYVAKISLGANYEQAIKAFKEAEEFDGPSIIIAYAPCVNHGINLEKTFTEMRRAVESGYWELFRYNPKTNTLLLDSGEPTISYEEFISGETRFSSLAKANPELSKELFEKAKQEAIARRNFLKLLSQRNN